MLCLSGFELYSRWVPLLFSHKIVEIERFALLAAILHECQNY